MPRERGDTELLTTWQTGNKDVIDRKGPVADEACALMVFPRNDLLPSTRLTF